MYEWVLMTIILLGTAENEWVVSQTPFKTVEKCDEAKKFWDRATLPVEQYHISYCIPVHKKAK